MTAIVGYLHHNGDAILATDVRLSMESKQCDVALKLIEVDYMKIIISSTDCLKTISMIKRIARNKYIKRDNIRILGHLKKLSNINHKFDIIIYFVQRKRMFRVNIINNRIIIKEICKGEYVLGGSAVKYARTLEERVLVPALIIGSELPLETHSISLSGLWNFERQNIQANDISEILIVVMIESGEIIIRKDEISYLSKYSCGQTSIRFEYDSKRVNMIVSKAGEEEIYTINRLDKILLLRKHLPPNIIIDIGRFIRELTYK